MTLTGSSSNRLRWKITAQYRCGVAAVALASLVFSGAAQPTNAEPPLKWLDVASFSLEGKGWPETDQLYDRLPAKAQGMATPSVWSLSKDSAGLAVRFVTDATSISARWKLRRPQLDMPHMPATGVSGLDLYVRFHRQWRWLGASRPDLTLTTNEALTTEKRLTVGMTPERRECLLYLPLYNGVDQVRIGVPPGATCQMPPPRPRTRQPIVFYGTSIVQGACASRPGMAYPAILGRRLDCPTINLGFSGSAHCELRLGQLFAELNPSVYVIDPLPNMSAEEVAHRMPDFLGALRAAHPRTPIVLVENTEMGDAQVVGSRRAGYARSNAELRRIYEQRIRAGDRKLFYIRGEHLLGDDGQGTVDRVHPTDLGFMRMADEMQPVLKRALRAAK